MAPHWFTHDADEREILNIRIQHVLTPSQLRENRAMWQTNARNRAKRNGFAYVLRANDRLVSFLLCDDGKIRMRTFYPGQYRIHRDGE